MSSDYCDRSSELLKCAQLFHQKVIAGRARMKLRSNRALCYKISPSSVFRGQFLPLVKHLTMDLSIATSKMCKLATMFEVDNQSQAQFAQMASPMAQQLNSEILSINQYLQKAVNMSPRVLEELRSYPQASKHVKAMMSTLEYRLADLSMKLRDFLQNKLYLLSQSACENSSEQPNNILQPTSYPVQTSFNCTPECAYQSKQSRISHTDCKVVPNFVGTHKSNQHSQFLISTTKPREFTDSLPLEDRLQMDYHHRQPSIVNSFQDQVQLQPQSVIRQRDSAGVSIRNSEQTIVQLGQIYQQFSFLVREQGDLVTRIDTHIDETNLNIDLAHSHLGEFLRTISSRRVFMFKVFAILIGCFLLFALFVR